jgi:hypothetical protein
MLLLTGPRLMYEVLHNKLQNKMKQIRFKHIIHNNLGEEYHNYHIVDINTGKNLFTKTNKIVLPNPYLVLFYERKLFYKNFSEINSIRIFVYPHPYVDTFSFMMNNNQQILVERKDSTEIWHFNLQLKIINNENSEDTFENLFYAKRTINLPSNLFIKDLPENIYYCNNLSQSILEKNLNLHVKEFETIYVLPLHSMKDEHLIYQRIDEIKQKRKMNYFTIIAITSNDNYNLEQIKKLKNICNMIIFFNTSICKYYCQEKNKPKTFICYTLSKLLNKNLYFFNFISDISKGINDKELLFYSVSYKNLETFMTFCEEELSNNENHEERFKNYYFLFTKANSNNLITD